MTNTFPDEAGRSVRAEPGFAAVSPFGSAWTLRPTGAAENETKPLCRSSRTCGRGIPHRSAGITLIECLVYLSVLFVIIGAAFALFYQCWDNSKALWRNADDVARALRVGEHWRSDIRQTTAQPRLVQEGEFRAWHFPHKTNEVIYLFYQGSVYRKATPDARPVAMLAHVKTCQMLADQRDRLTSWRWELELVSRRKAPTVRPMFTFQAVPGFGATP